MNDKYARGHKMSIAFVIQGLIMAIPSLYVPCVINIYY